MDLEPEIDIREFIVDKTKLTNEDYQIIFTMLDKIGKNILCPEYSKDAGFYCTPLDTFVCGMEEYRFNFAEFYNNLRSYGCKHFYELDKEMLKEQYQLIMEDRIPLNLKSMYTYLSNNEMPIDIMQNILDNYFKKVYFTNLGVVDAGQPEAELADFLLSKKELSCNDFVIVTEYFTKCDRNIIAPEATYCSKFYMTILDTIVYESQHYKFDFKQLYDYLRMIGCKHFYESDIEKLKQDYINIYDEDIKIYIGSMYEFLYKYLSSLNNLSDEDIDAILEKY